MKILKFALVLFIMAASTGAYAQKKRNKAEKPKKEVVKVEKAQPSAADLLYENMLESTQQVFIIDSIVADRATFLKHIPLPEECGTLASYDDFFNTQGHDDNYVYINEFGNKAYYSLNNKDGDAVLYTIDKLGDTWSKPTPLEGLENGHSQNYPFMMADGFTFYFSQKGDNSIGGYDIFVTRYDSDSGDFLKPNNIGLPFNSKGNDFFYMEDELDSLGWFVTDRNQPEGKVCIYTFVPTKNRKNIDISNLDDDQVRALADIKHISDTWPSEQARNVAMQRLKKARNHPSNDKKTGNVEIVINDTRTYTSPEQFRSADARRLYLDLMQAREREKADAEQLEALRDRYANADDNERNELRPTILDAERELEQLNIRIKESEKRVRNIENRVLNN